jgi:hypothetical protein
MNEKWIDLTVPNYLKEFRKRIEKYSEKDGFSETENGYKYQKKKRELIKSGFTVTISDAIKLLKNGSSLIINKFKNINITENRKIINDANLVVKSIEGEEEMLELIAPNFRSNSQSRWPGPVGYRTTINHLVAVSIRVHSMYPNVDFNTVIRAASRRIIVPALAHNLTFLRRYNRELFDFLLKSNHGLEKLKQKCELSIKNMPASKKISNNKEIIESLKWIRLLNTLLYFTRDLNNFDELVTEIQRLTLEHEVNPNSSSLWSELSLIASGDLSVDEILVSKVTAELDVTVDNSFSKPIISCARARFGLLRYSYGMIEEKELLIHNPSEALSRTTIYYNSIDKMTKINDKTATEGFGWAYLWSRYLLIKSGKQIKPQNSDQAGILIDNILSKLYVASESEDYRKLAVRYLTGFLTNPRFFRPVQFLRNQTSADHWIKQMKDEKLPSGMISLMNARVFLHKAYSIKDTDPSNFKLLIKKSLSLYADTLSSITASVYNESMMDGEVSAWAIPEMRMCIELLKSTILENDNNGNSTEPSLTNYQKALDIIGEMQFGVYFDKKDEEARLILGLEVATKC